MNGKEQILIKNFLMSFAEVPLGPQFNKMAANLVNRTQYQTKKLNPFLYIMNYLLIDTVWLYCFWSFFLRKSFTRYCISQWMLLLFAFPNIFLLVLSLKTIIKMANLDTKHCEKLICVAVSLIWIGRYERNTSLPRL